MSQHLGRRALIIGAGMGGLSAALAAAPHFEEVIQVQHLLQPPSALRSPELVARVSEILARL